MLMNIREALIEDIPAISTLITTLSKKFIVPTLTKEGADILIHSMNIKSIQSYFNEGYRYHVGTIDKEIIGVVSTRDNNHLYHLFVSEQCQGRGYASGLWDFAKAECIRAGSPKLITVNSSINAAQMYKKWGFIPISGVRESSGIKDIPMKLDLN